MEDLQEVQELWKVCCNFSLPKKIRRQAFSRWQYLLYQKTGCEELRKQLKARLEIRETLRQSIHPN